MRRTTKRVIIILLILLLGFPLEAFAIDARLSSLTDVQSNDWAKADIYRLSALGMLDGFDDGSFHPEDAISREAYVSLLVSAAKFSPTTVHTKISDVADGRWSAAAIQAAAERGVLTDLIANGTFHPASPITREEAADVLGRLLLNGAANRDAWLNGGWKTVRDQTAFTDGKSFHTVMMPYVYEAVNEGLFSGDPTGKFRPIDRISRKEAAAVIDRLLDRLSQDRELQTYGFYAIHSYSAINHIAELNTVITGWAELEYGGPGQASVNTSGDTTFRQPDGWQEVLQAAADAKTKKQLMVFASGDKLVSFLQDAQAQQAFVQSAASLLADPKYAYDGICIDFEGLKSTALRTSFVGLLQSLRRAIGDKSLTVTVPPPFFYQGYDDGEIAKTADALILMAYDFTNLDARAPSAPLPLVQASVTELLKTVPADKIVLGISKDATQWTDKDGDTTVSYPTSDMVESRIAKGVAVNRIEYPQFLRHIEFTDDRGSQEIWYEDAASIAEKIRLAKVFGLRGVSLWYMGNFTSTDWQTIASSTAAAK